MLDEGWLAFDAIKLTSLSDPIAVRPGQDHTLAAQVNGQLEGANAARLFIRYSDGTIGTVWQNESGFNGSQPVSGDFTTPAGAASFQVGTEVSLDQGHLSWTNVTLTAYSAAFSVTAGHTYQFTGQVTGTLAASLGQGGRITAVYDNGETLLWQNPANFNGTTTVQQTFTGNDSGAPTRLALTVNLAAGHLDFGNFDLQHLTSGDFIRRSTYTLAGQAVAVRVTGDPEAANNGRFYLYSDHLGSASAMQKGDGSDPIVTRYLPFGGYREGSGPNEVTDRGFTGQPENMDLGLYYYQARYYLPGIGRFASADSLVPNPANPQSYNRYSYMENRPLVAVDPTGHDPVWCNDPYDSGGDPACGPIAPLPDYVLHYQITFFDSLDRDPVRGTLTFIDANAALSSHHFLDGFSSTDIRELSVIDPATGEIITFLGPTNISKMKIHTGSELGEMENGLSLLLFPREILPSTKTASLGIIELPGHLALQATTFAPGLEDGLYATEVVGVGDVRREGSMETYPAVFVKPDLTILGDSGAPLVVNGTVRGINNGEGGGVATYGRITDIGLLHALITDYSR